MQRLLVAVSVVLLTVACQSPDPRRAVAEEFIDRLFVVIDQHAARELAVGLAVEKLDEEIRLKGDETIDEGTRQPRVTYALLEQRDGSGDDTASLVYELRVAPDGAERFDRHLMLTLRRFEGAWQVANYTLATPAASD